MKTIRYFKDFENSKVITQQTAKQGLTAMYQNWAFTLIRVLNVIRTFASIQWPQKRGSAMKLIFGSSTMGLHEQREIRFYMEEVMANLQGFGLIICRNRTFMNRIKRTNESS